MFESKKKAENIGLKNIFTVNILTCQKEKVTKFKERELIYN